MKEFGKRMSLLVINIRCCVRVCRNTDRSSHILENRPEKVRANPKQNSQRPAMQAIEHASYDAMSSSIPNGNMDDAMTSVPTQISNKKIGCDARTTLSFW
mmetsp:Transcript_23592/g.43847  ORF Transcript_23592/g.43847 Transcript_23592/m.43847 type:complete len:100 (+) Transcript_23592:912-1211(+)